jgi:DNA-binding CsgD family transcriptional regulator
MRHWSGMDWVLAVLLAAASQLEIWFPRLVPGVGEVAGNLPVLATTSVAATLPLAVRRRFPLAVLLAVMGALALQQVLTTPTEGLVLLLAGMTAAYSSSAFASVGSAAVAGVAIVLGSALAGADAGDRVFIVIVLGGAWLAGFAVLQRSTDLSAAREDNRELSVRLARATDQLTEAQRRLPSGPAPEDLATLTPREIEVARAIAKGMSNAEIAAELNLSEWTVKTHVGSILRKLGLRDRAQVVVAAYESGLVTPRASAE